MAKVQVSNEKGAELAERNPAPAVEREVQTLEVPGAPPAPESVAAPENEDVAKLTKKIAELTKGNKAKDKSLGDAKKRIEELQPQEEPAVEDDPSVDELIKKAVDAASAKTTKSIEKRLKPLLEEAATAKKQSELVKAVKEFGEEAVTEYLEQAEATQKEHGTLSLTQALKLVVPAQTSPQTAPQTKVESSRAPAPVSQKSAHGNLQDALGEAKTLRSKGQSTAAFETIVSSLGPIASQLLKQE